MKNKNFLLTLMFSATSISLNAQSFKKGANVAATGLEMANYLRPIFNTSGKTYIPALSLQYERGMWKAGSTGGN